MAFDTLSGGLELVIPTNGTVNWGTIVKNSTWLKINNHDHTGGGNGELLTAASFADNSISGLKLAKNLNLTEAPLVTVAANAALINWNSGNKASLDMTPATGDVTITLSNPIAGASYRLTIQQSATKQNILWPVDVLWPGGEEPTQFMQDGTKAMVTFDYDGTDYLAKWEIEYA